MENESGDIILARHDERLKDLEGWRVKQNGSIQRIEGRLNQIGWGIAFTLGCVVLDLLIRLGGVH